MLTCMKFSLLHLYSLPSSESPCQDLYCNIVISLLLLAFCIVRYWTNVLSSEYFIPLLGFSLHIAALFTLIIFGSPLQMLDPFILTYTNIHHIHSSLKRNSLLLVVPILPSFLVHGDCEGWVLSSEPCKQFQDIIEYEPFPVSFSTLNPRYFAVLTSTAWSCLFLRCTSATYSARLGTSDEIALLHILSSLPFSVRFLVRRLSSYDFADRYVRGSDGTYWIGGSLTLMFCITTTPTKQTAVFHLVPALLNGSKSHFQCSKPELSGNLISRIFVLPSLSCDSFELNAVKRKQWDFDN